MKIFQTNSFFLVLIFLVILKLRTLVKTDDDDENQEPLSSSFKDAETSEVPCDTDWEPFGEEKCLKVLDGEMRTFKEATERCHELISAKPEDKPEFGSGILKIRSHIEQRFIVNLLFRVHKAVDSVWLASKAVRNASSSEYSNWASRAGVPEIGAEPHECVQLTAEEPVRGAWIEVPCGKRNLVVCQRAQNWSLYKLQQVLMERKRELEGLEKRILKAVEDLVNKKDNGEDSVQSKAKDLEVEPEVLLPPIGFVYFQLPGDRSPETLWPRASWTDSSEQYAGVFFRVAGNGSAVFGTVQNDWAPRLTKVVRTVNRSKVLKVENPLLINPGKLSNSIPLQFEPKDEATDANEEGFKHSELAFLVSDGEVRPRNVAIRVWRRTG